MKRFFLLAVACCLAVCVAQAQNGEPAKGVSPSRIESGSIHSAILGADKEYRVYLPDGYDTDIGMSYPVLYLLHGAGGTCDTWPKNYNMKTITDWRTRSGFCLPMIIVMPDARGTAENNRGKNMGYFNVPGWNYQDFFFEEFLPEIERRYRIRGTRAFRAIAGLSMGGGGTTIYSMEHPELFSTACPLSARVEGVPERSDPTMADYLRAIKDHDMVAYLRNASPEVQEAIGQIRWYIDVGDNDYLFEGCAHLYLLMRELKFPCANFRVREGTHQQEYWRTALPEVLTYVSIGFAESME
ncbi:MAG: endo-1,4-beta-xylanase Z [Bacteroidales bacterium]|jgi:enterochelin esterase-like enzyme|nr:endo-1,4-beta-xylanase Z [Bacteroidales bacterium]